MSPSESPNAAHSAPPPPASSRWRWLPWLLRIVIPVGVLAYFFSDIPLSDFSGALSKVSASTLVASGVVFITVLYIAAWRWRLIMEACGATEKPPVLELLRLYWVATFYSTCLPGGLGGEVVRGAATRKLFGEGGMTVALGVALIERVLGLCGLLLIVTVTFILHPLAAVPNMMLWTSLGFGAVAASLGGILLAPKLLPYLPARLQRILSVLPMIQSLPKLAACLPLSVLTQSGGVITGHLVLSNIYAGVDWSESMVIMPIALTSQYFPLTVAGAGVREAAFVTLYGMVGVPKHDALAASLVVGAIAYVAAALGGLIQMLRPLTVEAES